MLRLLFILLVGLAAIGALGYLAYRFLVTPERRLFFHFKRVQRLILDGVDPEDRDRAEQLLEDCRSHLDELVRAHRRLERLSKMSDTASELTGAGTPDDLERLEADVRDDVSHFLSEMAQISSQLRTDDRRSLERLQDFTDELEERERALAELDDLD